MHPAVRIISLVIVSIFLTQGGWFTLLITGAILLPFYIVHRDLWLSAIKMLFRLKWFFISILLIYYFYTPDVTQSTQTTISQISGRIIPGLFRIAVLIIILFSVNLLIKTTSKEQILSALLWLFSPLNYFSVKTERISLRAVLTLEYIESLSLRLTKYKEKQSFEVYTASGSDSSLYLKTQIINFFLKKKWAFLHLIKHSVIILHEILEEAENTSGKSYTIDYLESPKAIQFIFPLILCMVFSLSL